MRKIIFAAALIASAPVFAEELHQQLYTMPSVEFATGSYNFDIPQFDPTLGTLRYVYIRAGLAAFHVSPYCLRDDTESGQTITIHPNVSMTWDLGTGGVVSQAAGHYDDVTAHFVEDANDGGCGPSYSFYYGGILDASEGGAAVLLDSHTDDMSQYIGLGNLATTMTVAGSLQLSSSDGISVPYAPSFGAYFGYAVDYEYVVPEPAALGLFGLGAVALGFARRRR